MTEQDQEHATVRVWTDLLARIRFGTVEVAGKKIRGALIKAVAYRAANYADSNGTRVRPGLPRLAVDLEIEHGTAKRAMQVLVRVGLLRLVHAGARPGLADEYRLTIPADLLDRDDVEVWSPAQQLLEIERVRRKTRGRYAKSAPTDPDPGDLQVPQGPADDDTCRSHKDPQKPDLQVPAAPADTTQTDRPAGPSGTDICRPAGPSGTDLQVPQGPATHHGPRHNYYLPTGEDLRTAVTQSRASQPEEESNLGDVVTDEPTPPRPRGCPDHGPAMAAGTRDDGKPACPLCRATSTHRTGDLAPVIPIRSAS